jgi:hypothetical protein
MATTSPKERRKGEQCRLELAGATLERLDIARQLLRLERVETRTALALQLLERVADDVAELAGRP